MGNVMSMFCTAVLEDTAGDTGICKHIVFMQVTELLTIHVHDRQ